MSGMGDREVRLNMFPLKTRHGKERKNVWLAGRLSFSWRLDLRSFV